MGYIVNKTDVGSPIVILSSGQAAYRTQCGNCIGHGYFLDEDYKHACVIHSVRFPERTDQYIVDAYGYAIEKPKLEYRSDGTKYMAVDVQIKDVGTIQIKTFRVAHESR